LELWYFITKS